MSAKWLLGGAAAVLLALLAARAFDAHERRGDAGTQAPAFAAPDDARAPGPAAGSGPRAAQGELCAAPPRACAGAS